MGEPWPQSSRWKKPVFGKTGGLIGSSRHLLKAYFYGSSSLLKKAVSLQL